MISMGHISRFFLLFTCLTTALASYRIENINPKCESVSMPICTPMSHDISILNGRNRRSLMEGIKSRSRTKRRTQELSTESQWRYNSTTFPNFVGDRTPDDVIESLRHLHPMISTKCSKFVQTFLCSIYSPVCTDFGVVPPCKELCEKVLADCSETIKAFGIVWPEHIKCSLFPSYDSSDDVTTDVELIGRAESMYDGIMIQRTASLIWMEALAADGKICIPPVDDDVIGPQLDLLSKNLHQRPEEKNLSEVQHTKANHRYGLWCPAEMRSPPGQPGYSFLGMQNCSPPCPNMYLNEGELSGIRYVIIVMSSLCIIVTFFALCTFLIDTKRFRYPERPIVFYALSYFIVSLVFLMGFVLKEDAACNEEIRDAQTNDIVQGFTVVKGDHKQSCTIIFMVLYYFTVNGTIWWLILTVTWLLAAGFKWGTEAIEKYSMYYHAIAWGIPAVQTMIVVTFGKIEGDNIAGVCFLGLYDSEGLRYMLLTPLCIYLFIGITILCLGFCCLNRVRMKLRNDEVNKRKLAKFMLRIGVFSVMYIVPQVILLVVYIIEDSNRTQWEASWFLKSCEDYRVPCPAVGSNVTVYAGDGSRAPNAMLFYAKYILTLIVALPPLFWVASKKTLTSWQNACCRTVGSPESHVVTINNNSNHKNRTSSRKALLRNESNHIYNGPRPVGDGGVEKDDDVFVDFANTNNLHGSSASVAAQNRAEIERDSRQNEVLQRNLTEGKPALPAPPPPPTSSGASVRKITNVQKQFPKKRLEPLTASSVTTSSRVTSHLQKQSSSMSSLTSDKMRRSRKPENPTRTSSLNRTEFKERLARDLARNTRSTSELTSQVTSSSSNLASGRRRGPPPPKPHRTASLKSHNAGVPRTNPVEPQGAPTEQTVTLVASLPETIGENVVEV